MGSGRIQRQRIKAISNDEKLKRFQKKIMLVSSKKGLDMNSKHLGNWQMKYSGYN